MEKENIVSINKLNKKDLRDIGALVGFHQNSAKQGVSIQINAEDFLKICKLYKAYL